MNKYSKNVIFIYLVIYVYISNIASYHKMLGSYFALFSVKCTKYEEHTNKWGRYFPKLLITKLNSQGISKEISSLAYTSINYLKCLELDGQVHGMSLRSSREGCGYKENNISFGARRLCSTLTMYLLSLILLP